METFEGVKSTRLLTHSLRFSSYVDCIIIVRKMENKEHKKKNQLLQILSKAKRYAQDRASKGREIVKDGQFVADLASCNEEFFCNVPDDSFFTPNQWDNQIAIWNTWLGQARVASTAYNSMQLEFLASGSASVATSTAISSLSISSLPADSQGPARKVLERYEQLLEKSNLNKELEIEIHRLNLTSSQAANESVLSLVQQAEQAFKIPSVKEISPSAVLIPLREAINRAFADLLLRRPKQEKAKTHRDKTISICKQCLRSGVAKEQIELLANEANDLNNLLSGAKQDVMNRDQVRELMNRGFVFLRNFLGIIDENKMRKLAGKSP